MIYTTYAICFIFERIFSRVGGMLHIIALSFTFVGDLIIACVVLSVHRHVAAERRIDSAVVRYMKKEQVFVVFGIILVAIGFVIELYLNL